MNESKRNEIKSKIVNALRKTIADQSRSDLGEMWINYGIDIIMSYVDALKGDINLNWRTPLGRNNVQREIAEIITIYEKLARKMNESHEPTFEILSAIGIGPFFERTRCENIIKALATITNSDEFQDLPATVGRGKSNIVQDNLLDALANTYCNITGNRPTRNVDLIDGSPYGAFDTLVADIFQILGIEKGAQAGAKRAVERYAASYGGKGE